VAGHRRRLGVVSEMTTVTGEGVSSMVLLPRESQTRHAAHFATAAHHFTPLAGHIVPTSQTPFSLFATARHCLMCSPRILLLLLLMPLHIEQKSSCLRSSRLSRPLPRSTGDTHRSATTARARPFHLKYKHTHLRFLRKREAEFYIDGVLQCLNNTRANTFALATINSRTTC
jgi:hypothetical protein